MSQKSSLFFKSLLSRFAKEKTAAALSLLPASEQKEVVALLPSSHEFATSFSPERWLGNVHYSWFYEQLTPLSEKKRGIYFGVLSQEQQKGLQEMIKGILPRKVPSFLHPFFLAKLKSGILQKEDVIALEQLPVSPMNTLLYLPKRNLVRLIDFLGIYDLAVDLRTVLDTTLLAKIHEALTKEELHFLQFCSKRPIKWMPPKLHLEGWDGNKESLHLLLHKRGLVRLAKSVFNEDPSFKWHLIHRLDTGRGKALSTLMTHKHDPALIGYFQGQVLHLLNRFEK